MQKKGDMIHTCKKKSSHKKKLRCMTYQIKTFKLNYESEVNMFK